MPRHFLLEKNKNPTEEEIRWGISGNLCRCTGYNKIVEAIQYAAEKLQQDAAEEATPMTHARRSNRASHPGARRDLGAGETTEEVKVNDPRHRSAAWATA